MPDGWRETASAAVGELRRVTTPSGRIVVVESLGTGVSEPGPPTPELAEFHDWLTDDCGLTCHTIATDYVFDSPAEAQELTAAFFGAEFAATLADDQVRIPEFTGVWTS